MTRGTPDAEDLRRSRPGVGVWLGVVLLVVAAAWAVARLVPQSGGARPEALNVLMITLDTTRADYLGCFGRKYARTPNIDRIAREGVLFTQCTTCSGMTLPSHASIMTGVYPFVHGARRNGTTRLSNANVTLAETLKANGASTAATVASFVLNRQFGTDQGFDTYHDVIISGAKDAQKAERKGDDIADDALDLLRNVAGQHFFLWVHFYDPHDPYESPVVAERDSPVAYAHEISFMDGQVGRLLDALGELELEQKTLVVVVADHGEGLGDHGELHHGNFLYDSVLHVALMFRLPGVIPAGLEIPEQVRTIDITPTILEALGIAAGDEMQGVSLFPLIAGEERNLGLLAYAETFENQVKLNLSQLRSVVYGGYKYIHAPTPELYDLGNDPGELRNLAAKQPQRAAEMRERLRHVLAEAPPPVAADARDAAVELSPVDVARLESLGYIGGSRQEDAGSELDHFEPEGGDPKDHITHINMRTVALTCAARGDFGEAERIYRDLIKVFPDVAQLRAALAQVLHKQGKLADALAVIDDACDIAPANYLVRRTYGQLLFTAERFQDAVDQFAITLDIVPDDTGTLPEISIALVELGRFDAAESYIQRGLELAPNDTRMRQVLGVLRLKQERLDEAEAAFHAALELDPQFAPAQAGLRYVAQAREK